MLTLVRGILTSAYGRKLTPVRTVVPRREQYLTTFPAVCHAHPPHATAFSTLGIPASIVRASTF